MIMTNFLDILQLHKWEKKLSINVNEKNIYMKMYLEFLL